MDPAILVALVMLVCVLTMLVLGMPISISIGLALSLIHILVRPVNWQKRQNMILCFWM